MDRREKIEFILYQMKLMLRKDDQVRFHIISKKINEEHLNDPDLVDLKMQYYAYLVTHFNLKDDYGAITRAYKIMWRTKAKPEGQRVANLLDFDFKASRQELMNNYVGFLALQSYCR